MNLKSESDTEDLKKVTGWLLVWNENTLADISEVISSLQDKTISAY